MGIEALVFGIALFLLQGAISRHGIRVEGTTLLITVVFLISLAGFYMAKTGKIAFGAVSGLMVVFLALISLKVMPVVSDSLQGTLHKYSAYAKERLSTEESIVLFRLNNPSVLFYSGRKVVPAWDKAGLEAVLGNGMRAFVIAKSGDIDTLAGTGLHLIEKDEKYALLERK